MTRFNLVKVKYVLKFFHYRLWINSEFDQGEFYGEGFEIVFDDDVPFGDQLIPVIQVFQSDARSWCCVGFGLHDIFDDDIGAADGHVDGKGCPFIEFIVFYGVFDEGLHGDGGNEEFFRGEVGNFNEHADGFAEADLQEVEVVADEFNFFAEEDEVAFFVAEDVAVDFGEGIIVESCVLGVAGDEEGKGVEGVEDKVGVDLVFEGFEFGLRFGDIELFDAGAAVFAFFVEEDNFVDIGDKAGCDDDNEGGSSYGRAVGVGFARHHFPDVQEDGGDCARVDDIDEEEGDDDLVVFFVFPGIFSPDEVHEPDVALPY